MAKSRVSIFVDDPESAFLRKSAIEKYNDWQEYDRIGREADIRDVNIVQEEGTPMKIVVKYLI